MAALNKRPEKDLFAERNIYFYRMDAGADGSGRPITVNMQSALKQIDGLEFRSNGGRYREQSLDDSILSLWVDEVGPTSSAKLGVIRRNALPQAELSGSLSDLILAEEQGLVEMTHACFFDDQIVGVEFNFFGPRATRIPWYVQSCTGVTAMGFVFEPLFRGDVAELLKGKSAIRSLELKIRKSYASTIQEIDDSLGRAFNAAAEAGNAETINIILKPDRYKRSNLRSSIMNTIRELVGRGDIRENAQAFKVVLIDEATGKPGEFNLLEDKLISKKKILRVHEKSRVLDSNDAYGKIREAYLELREELLLASSVSVNFTTRG